MGRVVRGGCSSCGKALKLYAEQNFARCEDILLRSSRACRECAMMLARLYYELGSPYRAAAVLNQRNLKEEAKLYTLLAEEGEMVLKEGEESQLIKDLHLNAFIAEGKFIAPLESLLLRKMIEEYQGIVPEKVLKEVERISMHGKRTS